MMLDQYMAGYVDGEGYISLVPHGGKGRNHNLVPVIKIASTNRIVLDLFLEEYGGWISPRKTSKGFAKPSWCWELKNKKLLGTFLKKINPYLIGKKRQCDIVMEFCNFPWGYSSVFHKKHYNPTLVEKAKQMYKELKLINHRGTSPATTE